MSYGSYEEPKEADKSETDSSRNNLPAGAPPVTDPSYAQWYYNWYNQAEQKAQTSTTDSNQSQNYSSDDYYKYYEHYYSQQKQGKTGGKLEILTLRRCNSLCCNGILRKKRGVL